MDDLVVYAVKAILEAGEECTFERLVFECYSLFPKQRARVEKLKQRYQKQLARASRRAKPAKPSLVTSDKDF